MFLYLIRHGHPNYDTDSLYPDGIEQAKLVARRMAISGVDVIYASSMGRAVETAQPTAEALGLPINVVDWARELGAESKTEFPDGKMKLISKLTKSYLRSGKYRGIPNGKALETIPGLCDSHFPEKYRIIADGVDGILAEHGYRRNERGFYDITEYNDKHIAVFCHNGMGRVVISHLLNIPYQFLGSTLSNQYTGVTVFCFDDGHSALNPTPEYRAAHPEFSDDMTVIDETARHISETGLPETSPWLVSYGDIGHLYFDGEQPVYFINKKGV